MPSIQEIATLTSKGQITLPKAVRQILGVETGGRVVFEVRDGEVIVTSAALAHDDPAIGSFLDVLEADIRHGRHIGSLPDDLARAMLESAGRVADIPDEFEGDVEL
jgi:antitoxin PrlF